MFTLLKNFQCENQNKINLLLNHLAVAYMFFVPFEPHGYAVSFIFFLLYLLLVIRGNYLYYLKISLSHPLVITFAFMMLIHYLWLIGNTDVNGAKDTLKFSHYFLYPFFFFLFLDQRFYPRLLASFLAGVMFSEFLSYLMQFNIIPHGYSQIFDVPWKKSGLEIIFYSSISGEPSPFLDHTWYSILLAVTGSIFFYKAFNALSRSHKAFNFIFFTSISINLFLIGGRTGYLLYFILIATIMFIMIRKKASFKMLLTGLILPLMVSIFMYEAGGLFKTRVDQTMNSITTITTVNDFSNTADGSFNEKYQKAQAAIRLISENFFFGVGTGDQVSELRSKPENIHNPIQRYRDVHDQYLDIFMQFGLIGFSFYLYLLYKIYRFKARDEEKNIVKTIALLAMIFSGFLASFWYFLPVLFTTLIVITSANKNILTNEVKQADTMLIFKYSLLIVLSYIVGILQ